MDEEHLYDEFGNYIGPDMELSGEDSGNDSSDNGNGGKGPGSDYAYEKAVSNRSPKQLIKNLVRTVKMTALKCSDKTCPVRACRLDTSKIRWKLTSKRTTSNTDSKSSCMKTSSITPTPRKSTGRVLRHS